jgi:two-component system, OmpR family, phosphate regulon sensor histidine kinase PhoR
MRKTASIKLLPALMVLTILAIAAFQVYWLQKAYEREKRTLEMRSNYLFRETIFQLQSTKLKLDKLLNDSSQAARVIIQQEGKNRDGNRRSRKNSENQMVNMMDVITKRIKDSGRAAILVQADSTKAFSLRNYSGRRNRLVQFLYDIDSIQDSVRIIEIERAYSQRLEDQNIHIEYEISRVQADENDEPAFNQVTLGFAHPITYKLHLGNTTPYLMKRISVPIIFSIFLVAFTFLSFMLLYRNMVRQRKLGEIKNEFISNITHELKTPIATVSVAIEALRSFNASMDASRTREYLDISANELQRLSLLVDKVLKLSMFEKKEIDLIYEPLNMKMLVDEVTSSMRLQFEKKNAIVNVQTSGDLALEGDRLHLVSVIFNLLDNALKYSPEDPKINIALTGQTEQVQLVVKDQGVGIPSEYHHKIFEKFFRVPCGNLHNTKGYGLGLSYVAHVVQKHQGTIKVESQPSGGSSFIINLPRMNNIKRK